MKAYTLEIATHDARRNSYVSAARKALGVTSRDEARKAKAEYAKQQQARIVREIEAAAIRAGALSLDIEQSDRSEATYACVEIEAGRYLRIRVANHAPVWNCSRFAMQIEHSVGSVASAVYDAIMFPDSRFVSSLSRSAECAEIKPMCDSLGLIHQIDNDRAVARAHVLAAAMPRA